MRNIGDWFVRYLRGYEKMTSTSMQKNANLSSLASLILGVILSHNKIEMDPAKIQAIIDWPVTQNVSDVRKFRGFANFYRRFIQDFGNICRPLDKLTGKVQWKWGAEEQIAFIKLKKCFMEKPVLCTYDNKKETCVETDASGYGTGAILLQKQEDGHWHPVAYLSQSMNDAKRNYDIYDKEMLAVIRTLEAWRHYLEGLPQKFQIISDHKNLEYWRTAQNLTRRQARWSLFLSRFDFELSHKPGKNNGAPDALSRQPHHQKSNEEDNLGQIVLKLERFRIALSQRGQASAVANKALIRRIRECLEKDREVAEALEKVQTLGPAHLQHDFGDWNAEQGLILY